MDAKITCRSPLPALLARHHPSDVRSFRCRRSRFSGTSEASADLKYMDIPLLVIGVLLVLTLTAFFTGFLPYPIGWIILSAAFIGRLLYLKAR